MMVREGLGKVAVAVITALIAVSVTASASYYCLGIHKLVVTKYVTVSVPKTVKVRSTVTLYRTLTKVVTKTVTKIFRKTVRVSKGVKGAVTRTGKPLPITSIPKEVIPRNDSMVRKLVLKAFKMWLAASLLKSLRAAYLVGGANWSGRGEALNTLSYALLASGLSLMSNTLAWASPPINEGVEFMVSWEPVKWCLSTPPRKWLSGCAEVSVPKASPLTRIVKALPINSSATKLIIESPRHGFPVKGVGEAVVINLTLVNGREGVTELSSVNAREGIVKYLMITGSSGITELRASWSVGGLAEVFSRFSNKLLFMSGGRLLSYVNNASSIIKGINSAVKIDVRFLRYEVLPGGFKVPEYLALVSINFSSSLNGVRILLRAYAVCNAYLVGKSLMAISNTVVESINSTVTSGEGVRYCYVITSPVRVLGSLEGVEELANSQAK